MNVMLREEWLFDETLRLARFDFRVRSDLPESVIPLQRLLGPLSCSEPVSGDCVYSLTVQSDGFSSYALYFGEDPVDRTDSGAWMFDQIMVHVTERSLFQNRDVLALHAGAVSLGGTGVLLPAAAGHGKSTLTCGLVVDGFDFLSDEAALLSLDEPVVHPFPRPIALEPPSLEVLPGLRERLARTYGAFLGGRAFLAGEDLRAGSAGKPCRVRHVVLPEYVEGARTVLSSLGKAEALVEMTEQCFNRAAIGGPTLEVLGRVLEGSTCHRLTVGDLPAAVAAIRQLVSP